MDKVFNTGLIMVRSTQEANMTIGGSGVNTITVVKLLIPILQTIHQFKGNDNLSTLNVIVSICN